MNRHDQAQTQLESMAKLHTYLLEHVHAIMLPPHPRAQLKHTVFRHSPIFLSSWAPCPSIPQLIISACKARQSHVTVRAIFPHTPPPPHPGATRCISGTRQNHSTHAGEMMDRSDGLDRLVMQGHEGHVCVAPPCK